MSRPIRPVLLQYAANDIRAIRALFHHFLDNKWITSDPTSLLESSDRYATIHSAPVDEADIFAKGGQFLPLDILTVLDGPRRKCVDCKRDLSEQHYAAAKPKSCRVCEALKANARRYPRRG